MEVSLIEKTRQTRIKVKRSELAIYKTLIETFSLLYGACIEKENSKYVYYIVNADLLNKK